MRKFALSLMFSLIACTGQSEELGRLGQTYPIDRDARAVIKEILTQKKASGELDKFWIDYRNKTLASIRNPQSLGLPVDVQQRSQNVELSFVVPNDYKDASGRVIVKRGTLIKPLERLPLKWSYIFIDGTDEAQVRYAVKKTQQIPLKIILTAGSPLALRERFKNSPWMGSRTIPFYFDQRAAIIKSFKTYYGLEIKSVPVMLSQQGSSMRLDWGMPTNNKDAQ